MTSIYTHRLNANIDVPTKTMNKRISYTRETEETIIKDDNHVKFTLLCDIFEVHINVFSQFVTVGRLTLTLTLPDADVTDPTANVNVNCNDR